MLPFLPNVHYPLLCFSVFKMFKVIHLVSPKIPVVFKFTILSKYFVTNWYLKYVRLKMENNCGISNVTTQ